MQPARVANKGKEADCHHENHNVDKDDDDDHQVDDDDDDQADDDDDDLPGLPTKAKRRIGSKRETASTSR